MYWNGNLMYELDEKLQILTYTWDVLKRSENKKTKIIKGIGFNLYMRCIETMAQIKKKGYNRCFNLYMRCIETYHKSYCGY